MDFGSVGVATWESTFWKSRIVGLRIWDLENQISGSLLSGSLGFSGYRFWICGTRYLGVFFQGV